MSGKGQRQGEEESGKKKRLCPERAKKAPSVSLLAAVGVPIILVGGIELGLRLLGFGFPSRFVLAYRNGSERYWVENQRFAWRFFPISMARYPIPFCTPARPTDDRIRILVFGESAAQGDPLPAFSFSRIPERLLRHRFPQKKIEVLNLAFTAINSHVIRYIARDSRLLHGDIWILYIGNNEVVGPYGAGTVLGWQAPPQWLITMHQLAVCSRIGQSFQALKRTIFPGQARPWQGMSMFVRNQITANDPRLQRIYRQFEANLTDIVHSGKSSGADVLLCTVAVNLKDCAPFGSMHRADLSADLLQRFGEMLNKAVEAYVHRQWEEVVELCNHLLQIDDRYAAVYYLRARALGMLGQFDRARNDLIRACDLDTLRFRADSVINQLIRSVGKKTGATLVDVAHELGELEPWRVPGEPYFIDHVHFSFEGNYRVALLLARRVEEVIRKRTGTGPDSSRSWPDQEACGRSLGYGPLYEWTALNFIRERMLQPPYPGQIDYTQRFERLSTRVKEREWASKPAGMRQALRRIEEALQEFGDDWRLHEMRARIAAGLFAWDTARSEWMKVADLLPHSALPFKELGKLLLERDRPDEAIEVCREGLKREPWNPELLQTMGVALWRKGATAQARRYLTAALRLNPTLEEAARLMQQN